MTIKLPFILSAMIAALAIPGALASEADSSAAAPDSTAAAPEAAPEAAAPEAKADEKPKMKKKKHRRHHHRRGSSGSGHTPDEYDQPYDYINRGDNSDSSGCGVSDSSGGGGKILPEETPGQKGPQVAAGS